LTRPPQPIRPLTISSATNGYIVTVACMTLIFEDRDEMLREIRRYLDNPVGVEQEYAAMYGNVATETIAVARCQCSSHV
jgi:hypothetical protein